MRTQIQRWVTLMNSTLSHETISTRVQYLLLITIVLSCIIVRIAVIDVPDIDRTHWKEIDYITISRNYWQGGYLFLRPEVSWPAEPPRTTAMELPIVPFGAAILYKFLGFNALSVRLIPLLSYLLLVVYGFRLISKEMGPIVGLSGAFALAFLPLLHPFGVFLFSEPTLIALSVVSIFHYAQFVAEGRKKDWIIALITLSLCLSLKPTALYLLIPLAWISYRSKRNLISAAKQVFPLLLPALILPFLWYLYAFNLDKTSINHFSIFRGHNKFQTFSMLSNPGWYRIMFSRLVNDVMGGKLGFILMLLGVMIAIYLRLGGIFIVYTFAAMIFFTIVAEGQVDAPYRQMVIIPPLASFIGLGVVGIVTALYSALPQRFSFPGNRRLVILFASFLALSVIPIRRYQDIIGWGPDPSEVPVHADRWEFARLIEEHTESTDKLIVIGEYSVHNGGNDLSPVLYYYSGLQGWTLEHAESWEFTVEGLITNGATHLVYVPMYGSPTETPSTQEEIFGEALEVLRSKYPILVDHDNLLLLDLTS